MKRGFYKAKNSRELILQTGSSFRFPKVANRGKRSTKAGSSDFGPIEQILSPGIRPRPICNGHYTCHDKMSLGLDKRKNWCFLMTRAIVHRAGSVCRSPCVSNRIKRKHKSNSVFVTDTPFSGIVRPASRCSFRLNNLEELNQMIHTISACRAGKNIVNECTERQENEKVEKHAHIENYQKNNYFRRVHTSVHHESILFCNR